MRYIKTQLIIAALGIGLVGGLLHLYTLDLDSSFLPAAGGIYTEGVIGTPEILNPLVGSRNPPDRDLICLIHAGLMRFDSAGLPVPDLAESWAVTADGLSYTFVLRSHLLWQDGVNLTLDDVIYTIKLMQHPDFPGIKQLAEFWRSVEVSKLNENTLKLTLLEAYAPFLDYTTFGVLPAHIFSATEDKGIPLDPDSVVRVGAGPFVLESLNSGTEGRIAEAILVANPHYHGRQPMLSQVRLWFYPDETSALIALQQGDVDGLGNLSPAAVLDILQQTGNDVYSGHLPEQRMILLNQRNESLPFFREKKVRQALLAGLNRAAIRDNILQGQAIVASGPIVSGTWSYNPNLTVVKYEPDRAIDLLEAADWLVRDETLSVATHPVRQKNGKDLNFTLLVPNDVISVEIGRQVVANWKPLGVGVILEALPSEILLEKHLTNRNFEAILVNLSLLGAADPDPYPFWHQTEIDTGQNYSGYDNRRISELLEQARVTSSLSERARLYSNFQARFVDQTPALLLYYPVYSYVVDPEVRGVQIGQLLEPSDRFRSISKWYMLTRRVVSNLR